VYAPGTTWRLARGCHLRWRSWEDDEFVVYHVESGDTHLLNSVSAEALRSLEQAPADADELTGRVSQRLEIEPTDTLKSQLRQLLAEFDQLGLIEPVDASERPSLEGGVGGG
jgi:PqqD family protein of HPr-rel-A system